MEDERSQRRTGSQQAVEDPVCGMMINPEEAEDTFDYEGETYYFCCEECKDRFRSNPEEYIP